MTTKPSADRIVSRTLLAMAYNRETFKDKIEEYISGAILEFYKARLATKNKRFDWVDHWMKEVYGLLNRSLVAALVHEIRGFQDRQKAFNEVVVILKDKDSSYRRIAENIIKRDYNLRKLSKHLDDSDTEAFWDEVVKAVRTTD